MRRATAHGGRRRSWRSDLRTAPTARIRRPAGERRRARQQLRVRDGGGGGRRPFLQGVVDAAASPRLTILGIEVLTSGATEFQDEGDVLIGGPAFFSALVPGRTLVKVRWETGVPLTSAARSAEIEAEDD